MIVIKNEGGNELRLFEVTEHEDTTVEKNRAVEISTGDVQEVFDLWVASFRSSTKGPKPVLSDKRRSKIQKALKDYGLETCLDAVRGCALSDWHMGDNPRGKRYDDLELIFRDSAHIERFATIYAENGDSARAEFLSGDEQD